MTTATVHKIAARLKALIGGSETSSIYVVLISWTLCKVVRDPLLRSKLGSLIAGMVPETNEGRLGPVLIISMTEPLRGCMEWCVFVDGTTIILLLLRFEPRVGLLEEEISLDDCHQNEHYGNEIGKKVRVFGE